MNARTLLMIALTLSLVTVAGLEARSAKQRRLFEQQTGYPHGRPGFVVDHIRPICYAGLDAPGNMQWQDDATAAAKDVDERGVCAAWRQAHKSGLVAMPTCPATTLPAQKLCSLWQAFVIKWGAGVATNPAGGKR